METVVAIADRRALEAEIAAKWYEDGQIVVKPYGFDDRIDWDAHIVTVNGVVVGFTNGPL